MTRMRTSGLVLCLLSVAVACGGDDGDGGGTKRVDLDIAGCSQGAQALSLLVRLEASDGAGGQCRVVERCLDVTFTAATADDVEDALRSQGFPLFDVAADEVERVTVALSATSGCPLGVLTTACGSAPLSAENDVVTINLDCGTQPACGTVSGDCATSQTSAPYEDETLVEVDVVESLD